MNISIVTTLYYSEPYIQEFYKRIIEASEKITHDFELIFVNDGSPDNSLQTALDIHKIDHRVKVIDLSRNFGHHRAIMTGLNYAQGKYVFIIDSDLEEEPELINTFYERLTESESDIDVVYGVQSSRSGNIWQRVTGHLFYRAFNFLSDEKVAVNHTITRLMTRRFVESLLEYTESEIVIGGLFSHVGYRQEPIEVTKKYKGKTTYNLTRQFTMMVNSITSFSALPLIMIWWIGLAITLFSIGTLGYLIVLKWYFNAVVDGWTGIMVSVWLFGGLSLFCLGVIGIYISKIFSEVKRRPLSVVRKYYHHQP